MARKRHHVSVPRDASVDAALKQYADVLDPAPPEHRPWLEKVVALACFEPELPPDYRRLMAENMMGRIRRYGLARGVIDFLARDGTSYFWSQLGIQPSRQVLFSLVRAVLPDSDAIWRSRAVVAAIRLAPTEQEAVSLLAGSLQDRAASVRWFAALGLSGLAPRTPGVVEELARVVSAEQPTYPSFGTAQQARALAGLGAPAGFTMRRGFPDAEVVGWPQYEHAGAAEAAQVLGGMGKLAAAALAALRERLNRGPGRTPADLVAWRASRAALDAITGSREEGKAILVGWVRRALSLEVPGEVGRQLLADLGQIDPTGVEVGPIYLEALRNPTLAVTAAAALYGAGSAGLPALASALAHERPAVRAMAARTLARMGSKAGAVVPALVWALNDPDAEVRQAVNDALASIHSYLFVTRHLGRSEEEAFLESILESLGDEAPCLIYADWLEDHGSAAAQACAQIVRERLLRRRNEE